MLAIPIVNFLIPCYHQNSLRFIVKHILFQHIMQCLYKLS